MLSTAEERLINNLRQLVIVMKVDHATLAGGVADVIAAATTAKEAYDLLIKLGLREHIISFIPALLEQLAKK